jgi:hypothetical protein
VLRDRVVTIKKVTQEASANTTVIRVDVVVRNTGVSPFPDQTARFQVMTPEGDVFQARAISAPARPEAIAGGESRAATLVFDVPSAAVASSRLAYRPAADAQTVFMDLQTS